MEFIFKISIRGNILPLTCILLFIILPALGQAIEWQWIDMLDTIKGYYHAVDQVAHYKYPPANIFDSNLSTCWVLGSSSIYLKPHKTSKVLNLFGGYGKSKLLYYETGS